MVRAILYSRNSRAVVNTQFFDHLRNTGDVVVAAANEGDEGFPWVLAEDADAGEAGGFFLEVRVLRGPLRVQGREVRGEIEVVCYQAEGVVGVWRVRGSRFGV